MMCMKQGLAFAEIIHPHPVRIKPAMQTGTHVWVIILNNNYIEQTEVTILQASKIWAAAQKKTLLITKKSYAYLLKYGNH